MDCRSHHTGHKGKPVDGTVLQQVLQHMQRTRDQATRAGAARFCHSQALQVCLTCFLLCGRARSLFHLEWC